MIAVTSATDILRDRINDLSERIKNGETEKSYQIGAQSFTDTEWSSFLEQFDYIQEEMTKQMREGHEHKREDDKEKKIQDKILDENLIKQKIIKEDKMDDILKEYMKYNNYHSEYLRRTLI